MKTGTLRRDTLIWLGGSLTLKIRRGTRVFADGNTLMFEGLPYLVRRISRSPLQFVITVDHADIPIMFPEGGIPYPFVMIK